jgi:hypothetical protein
VVEIEGREHVRSAEDGVLCVPGRANHRLYPFRSVSDAGEKPPVETRVFCSGQKTARAFQEDILFLENWYKYQDDAVMNKKKFDIIQVLCVSEFRFILPF